MLDSSAMQCNLPYDTSPSKFAGVIFFFRRVAWVLVYKVSMRHTGTGALALATKPNIGRIGALASKICSGDCG